MMMAGEKVSSFSRYQPQEEVWRKKWDPNKHSHHHHHHHAQKNEIRTNSHEKDSGQEETDNAQQQPQHQHRRCCGGAPCRAAQRRTQFDFGKVLSALTETDSDVRNLNRNLANKYKLPVSLVENLHDVFNKFDLDHDGTVSGKEILDVFQTLGAVFTRQQCDDVLKSFLGGRISGEIDFEEMIKMFAHRKSNAKDYQQDLELAFRMFDMDGDGYVCADDLKKVMQRLGNDLTDDEIRVIYSHLDTDDNGLIDFREFESILYPNVRPEPIMKQQRRNRSPRSGKRSPRRLSPRPSAKMSAQKKPAPKRPIVSQLGPIKAVAPVGSGIYNMFYSYSRGSAASNVGSNVNFRTITRGRSKDRTRRP